MRLALLALLIAGCRSHPQQPTLHTYEQDIMHMHLVVHTPRTSKVEAIIKKTFKQVDQIFNNWNQDSEISKLNQLPAYQRVEISSELATLLQQTAHIVEITDGRFDPTVGPLVHMWKTHLKNGTIPSQSELLSISEAVGWDKIHLEGTVFYKEDPRIEIDLCGIAKGYALDLLVERLGGNSYAEWGGEISTIGPHPDHRKWRVGILGGEVVEIEDKCVATSGGYLQKWEVDGVEYTHLINPRTNSPLIYGKGIASATVIADSCMKADAIATSLMFFSTKEEAEAWASKLDIEIRLIDFESWKY
ncbi:MAG: FAD:protein FMN transferase [Chlamydiales bacterium]|nr:FAD:protein FMN transferase [Chlamydiales bacterium]